LYDIPKVEKVPVAKGPYSPGFLHSEFTVLASKRLQAIRDSLSIAIEDLPSWVSRAIFDPGNIGLISCQNDHIDLPWLRIFGGRGKPDRRRSFFEGHNSLVPNEDPPPVEFHFIVFFDPRIFSKSQRLI
jgi:hypothetical protein